MTKEEIDRAIMDAESTISSALVALEDATGLKVHNVSIESYDEGIRFCTGVQLSDGG